MHSLHRIVLSQLAISLLLWSTCISQTPKTDILDCGEVQIQNANLHPALNGYYTRTQGTYNNLPVFQNKMDDKTRYIWWNTYDEFTRWSIGTEQFSSSIEGFMDNLVNDAYLLGQGRSWHVVNQQEWTVDADLNIICSKQSSSQGSNQSKPPPPRGGRPPPRRKSGQTPQQVIRITDARNDALNTIYYPTSRQYDNNIVYKTDRADRIIYIFHFSYDDMQRWYIGNTLGSDYDVLAFIEENTGDLQKDGTSQIWSEHLSDGEWVDNINLKFVLQQNQFINNVEQKQPPLNRDRSDERRQSPQQQQQQPPPPNQQKQQQSNQQKQQQPNQQKQQRQTQQNDEYEQTDQKQEAPNTGERTVSAEDARNERRKQMFRRVNKLDLDVQSSGKFESGIDVRSEPDIIITGSDDKDINTVYFVQPVRYNERSVYKSQSGSYLYFVRYVESDAARWQIGQPNGGVKNDQPIAFVNADTEYPYDIATWQAWLVFDKKSQDWVRQSRVNTYRGDCIVTVMGARNDKLNGEYGILPLTHETRPVFERQTEQNERVDIYFNDGDAQFSRWIIGRPNGLYLDSGDLSALISSSALTVDGVSDFETWQEAGLAEGERITENNELKVTGTCSKVKEHDWKRRRRQRAEERKRRKAMDAAKEAHCPLDLKVATDPGRDTAVVHWQAYNTAAAEMSEDEYDVVYSDKSIAPGSEFRLGRTAVTYDLKDKTGNVVIKCDFIITVQDTEAPNIQCPGDLYLMTLYNRDTAIAKFNEPAAFDNSNQDVEMTQIGGPQQGQTLRVGQYMISYEAKDMYDNSAICNFGLYVVDRQSPKIQNCPQSVDIAVYKDQGYAAYPEWEEPIAWDNVDGNDVLVRLIQGVPPGTKMSIPIGDKKDVTTQIAYEAIDSSDNAARCSFNVRLMKDMTASGMNIEHQEYHDKIKKTITVEETEEQYEQHLKEDDIQDDDWSEKARRLREERELQNKQRKAAKVNKKMGHRSSVHEAHVKTEVHDFEESLRLEDELRDETNDEAQQGKQNTKKKPMTRAERRKKRRQDRERRRKERAARRGKNKKEGKEGQGGGNPFSIVFWSTVKFFWASVRPWVWPLWLSIPFLVICCCGMGWGAYCVYDEIGGGDYRRGRRVPRYDSWSYKIATMFNRKTTKQRV